MRETAHELSHQPGGKASAPVLRQRADGADETNRLRARVVRVALDLTERDGGRLAPRRRHCHEGELGDLARDDLLLRARRETPVVRKGAVEHTDP